MTYEITRNEYGRYVLFRTRDFCMIASSEKQGPLEALRKDIVQRVERAHSAKLPSLPYSYDPRQDSEKNVVLPLVRT
jgi:hypothetical protein